MTQIDVAVTKMSEFASNYSSAKAGVFCGNESHASAETNPPTAGEAIGNSVLRRMSDVIRSVTS
jgi:hypothetical protein